MGRSPSGYAWQVTPNSEQITQDPIRPVYPDSRTDQGPYARMDQPPSNVLIPQPSESPRRKQQLTPHFEKPSNASSLGYSRYGRNSLEFSMSLAHSERRGTAESEHNAQCQASPIDGRKSFCSGHSSTSSVIAGYNIIYLIWAGYIRGGDAAFMGLDKKTGWRGGRRYLRELGHGLYLMWMLLNFTFVWAVGVSRFTDNKHNISDEIDALRKPAQINVTADGRVLAPEDLTTLT
ncbi:hypothetical protein WJX79_009385 [Trebouxia sp. C0005]